MGWHGRWAAAWRTVHGVLGPLVVDGGEAAASWLALLDLHSGPYGRVGTGDRNVIARATVGKRPRAASHAAYATSPT